LIRYRAMKAADVPVLRAMLQALSDQEGGRPVASEAALLADGFGARPAFRALVAEVDAPLGVVVYYPSYSTLRGEAGVYVLDLFVVEAARGKGVGRGLLAAVMAAQDWGAQYLTLSVSPGNVAAKAFYDKAGFRAREYDFLTLDGAALEGLAR
jgi:ribosomal protein S18 acetylase RimI-like enzyme